MRALEASRAVFGVCQVVFPAPIYRVAVGQQPDSRVRAVMRILGARHLIQAVAVGAVPTSTALHLGAGVVDSLHSVSMIALAIADRRRRRPAALDAVIAGLFAGMEFVVAGRRKRGSPAPERRWRG
ncbi:MULTISPECIES: hypothetical protein [unclassified Pseudarthrobacter]|jgi:hypothetical protein|uniref:hypothetical protein n=1 Tax=unclassified Pseudarthrobacter TaxID=2647000 RepID=UPI00255651B5|nr:MULTISPECIES: hypothetical protein [unclassified Pseudarthrobacter]